MHRTFILPTTFETCSDAYSFYTTNALRFTTQQIEIESIVTNNYPIQTDIPIEKSQTVLHFDKNETAKSTIQHFLQTQKPFVMQKQKTIDRHDFTLTYQDHCFSIHYPIQDSFNQIKKYVYPWCSVLSDFMNISESKIKDSLSTFITQSDISQTIQFKKRKMPVLQKESLKPFQFKFIAENVGRHSAVKEWIIESQDIALFDLWFCMQMKNQKAPDSFLISEGIIENSNALEHRYVLQKATLQQIAPLFANQHISIDCLSSGTLCSNPLIEFTWMMHRNALDVFEFRLILNSDKDTLNLQEVAENIFDKGEIWNKT
ncbi:MAG: hypothetical protein KDD46_06885 [Bdellovibrionales bacterium]|nr:hypothetical protein [Bdellovibrionales bacterium]